MKKLFLFVLLFIGVLYSFSQSYVDISNTGTCRNALDISRFSIFGPTTAPDEIGGNNNSFDLAKHPKFHQAYSPCFEQGLEKYHTFHWKS